MHLRFVLVISAFSAFADSAYSDAKLVRKNGTAKDIHFFYKTYVSGVMKTLRRNGLKGQEALSPGQRPGYKGAGKFALKGQKLYLVNSAFALSGRWLRVTFTQGDALGLELSAFQAVLR